MDLEPTHGSILRTKLHVETPDRIAYYARQFFQLCISNPGSQCNSVTTDSVAIALTILFAQVAKCARCASVRMLCKDLHHGCIACRSMMQRAVCVLMHVWAFLSGVVGSHLLSLNVHWGVVAHSTVLFEAQAWGCSLVAQT